MITLVNNVSQLQASETDVKLDVGALSRLILY